MKTTVDITDSLLKGAKRYATEHNVTLREVIEMGLRGVLQAKESAKPFRLKRMSFRGEGLQAEEDWAAIREQIYTGRGA